MGQVGVPYILVFMVVCTLFCRRLKPQQVCVCMVITLSRLGITYRSKKIGDSFLKSSLAES